MDAQNTRMHTLNNWQDQLETHSYKSIAGIQVYFSTNPNIETESSYTTNSADRQLFCFYGSLI